MLESSGLRSLGTRMIRIIRLAAPQPLRLTAWRVRLCTYEIRIILPASVALVKTVIRMHASSRFTRNSVE